MALIISELLIISFKKSNNDNIELQSSIVLILFEQQSSLY